MSKRSVKQQAPTQYEKQIIQNEADRLARVYGKSASLAKGNGLLLEALNDEEKAAVAERAMQQALARFYAGEIVRSPIVAEPEKTHKPRKVNRLSEKQQVIAAPRAKRKRKGITK